MKLDTQKKLAADVMKVSEKRVIFNPERLEDIQEAITKTDIRGLVSDGAIEKKQKRGNSRGRIRHAQNQRKKGLRKGASTRKGTRQARIGKKKAWMSKVRTQREFLKTLRDKELILNKTFTQLYKKVKGNFFRSKRHIKIYLKDHNLMQK